MLKNKWIDIIIVFIYRTTVARVISDANILYYHVIILFIIIMFIIIIVIFGNLYKQVYFSIK